MWRLVALTMVGVLALGGVADAKRVASAVDDGSVPLASASAWIHAPTHAPTIQVDASPQAAVTLSLDVQCFKGSNSRRVSRDLPPQTPSIRRRIKLTISGADDCYVSADASYDDIAYQSGRIAVAIFY